MKKSKKILITLIVLVLLLIIGMLVYMFFFKTDENEVKVIKTISKYGYTLDENETALYKEEFEKLGAEVLVTTVDGSFGIHGFVTDALKTLSGYTHICTCGPEPMLKAVYNESEGVGGQYSFEERMGCGFGACMGCSCKTKYGYKRICKDGPVLLREEIVW